MQLNWCWFEIKQKQEEQYSGLSNNRAGCNKRAGCKNLSIFENFDNFFELPNQL